MMVDNPTKYDLAFYVDKDTLKKANKWINTHRCIYKKANVGRSISWRFTLCGIGISTVVQCSCGKEKKFNRL